MCRRLLPWLALFLAVPRAAASQDARPVGFRFLWTTDASRAWNAVADSARGPWDPVGRPLRISVWYPARPGAAPMPFSAYVETPPPDPSYGPLVDVVEAYDRASYRGLFDGDSAGLARFLRSPTGAALDAEPAAGPFPLVLYSAGWGNRSSDNTLLAEAIARRGYVVVTVPQLAARRPRIVAHSTLENLEAQARDLETAMARAFALPFVDRRRVAAIGYSTGGRVALVLAARNPNVDAAAGLDPSYAFSEDAARIHAEGTPDPLRIRVPVLTIHHADPKAADLSVLDSMPYATRWTFTVEGATHGDFSDDTPERARYGLEGEADPAVHAMVVATTLRFLDETVGPGAGAGASPLALAGLAPGRVADRPRPGVPAPDPAGWAALVRAAGLPAALERLRDLESHHPGIEVADEGGLNDRAYYLVDRGEAELAADLLRLDAAAHPESVNVHDSLGEICLTAGDKECARAAYSRVLELLPDADLPGWIADYYRKAATRALERLGG